MLKKSLFVKTCCIVGSLCLTLLLPSVNSLVGLSARADDPPAEKIECREVHVKDYPLRTLVSMLLNKCSYTAEQKDTEELPIRGVSANSDKGGDDGTVLKHLAGKLHFSAAPLLCGPGKFSLPDGYTPSTDQPNKVWLISLTNDLAENGTLANGPIPKGKLRLYRDTTGQYRIHSNAASAKSILDLLYRVYGEDKDVKVLALVQGVAKKLFELGLTLEKEKFDVNVSLNEEIRLFDDTLQQTLVKKIYKAHLAAAPVPETATELWPLTFVPSRITPAVARTGSNSVDGLVEALQAIYGEKSVQRSRQMLLLNGTDEQRLAMKRLLAEYDLPWSQVQMNIWTIQVSGQPERVMPKLQAIKHDIALTQAAMDKVRAALNVLINKKAEQENKKAEQEEGLKKRLSQLNVPEINFIRRAEDVLSLNEALIMLALLDDPTEVINGVNIKCILEQHQKAVQESYQTIRKTFCTAKNQCPDGQPCQKECKDWRELDVKIDLPPDPTLKQTGWVYAKRHISRAHRAVVDFAKTLIEYRKHTNDQSAPAKLRRDSAVVDRLLQGAMDAYAADLHRLFLDPLLLRIQQLNTANPKRESWGREGVALTGNSRLVVTSSLTTSLKTQTASYANATRPKPFNVNTLLDTAFPRQERFSVLDSVPAPAATPTPTATATATPSPPAVPTPQLLTGAARIFGTLGSGEAFLLAAALANDVEPNFHEVTPGITIEIQPTVLPDGSAARIALKAEFKVETAEFGNKENVWKQPFADSVKKHEVNTDVAVSVFDLFDISSFSLQSSYPQAPYYVPVLGRLPIIGPAFQWPRDKKRVHHESIVLVNTVILPRAYDLARYYGGN